MRVNLIKTGKDCMKSFCKNLKEHTMKITNFEKINMLSLTDEGNEQYKKNKPCYVCKKELNSSIKKYYNV